MEVCVLASGSKGNCICVKGHESALMIDGGLSARELGVRLQLAGVAPEALSGLLITHDHIDHSRGVEVFARRHGTRLYANEMTAAAVESRMREFSSTWNIFETASPFTVGEFEIEPFSISHDAADPVGFLLHGHGRTLCIATDLGQATTLVRAKVARSHLAIIESNHDYDMLMASSRSWQLKQRINGNFGHLSNEDAAELLSEAAGEHLHTLLLAHLSEECNCPKLALSIMRRALARVGRGDIEIAVLQQNSISASYKV